MPGASQTKVACSTTHRALSTETFTLRDWPLEKAPCVVPDTKPVEPASEAVAEEACRRVWDKNMHSNCVFDVIATGNPGFAKIYLCESLKIVSALTCLASKAAYSV